MATDADAADIAPSTTPRHAPRLGARFGGLDAIQARMDLIATFPIHVNGAYLQPPAQQKKRRRLE